MSLMETFPTRSVYMVARPILFLIMMMMMMITNERILVKLFKIVNPDVNWNIKIVIWQSISMVIFIC